MNDEVVRLSLIGQTLRRRWLALAALTIIGALIGAAASLVLSPGYKATSQILLRDTEADTDLTAQAQLATSATVLNRTADALGWDITSTDLRDMVHAEVSDGALLEVTGAAGTPRAAQLLTNQVATEYIAFATTLITTTTDASTQTRQAQLDALQQQVLLSNDRIDELHREAVRGELTLETVRARSELEALRKDLADAMSKLAQETEVPAGKQPVVIDPAQLPSSKAAPTMTHLAAGGAVAFLLFGGFGFVLAARGDTRLRDGAEIGAALGIPVTGTVAMPDKPLRRSRQGGNGQDAGTDPHCRRILARLANSGENGQLRLLLIAADDDVLAQRAVARLAMAAGADGTPRTVLRVAHIDPADPMLDEGGDVARALLVLSAGTRTGWELVGIATACADAGHPLAGSVLATRVKRLKPVPQLDTGAGAVVDTAAEHDDSLAGSS